MDKLAFLIAGVVLLVLLFIVSMKRYNNNLLKKLRDDFGKFSSRKYNDSIMECIAEYFKLSAVSDEYSVDSITWQDLDMDAVFKKINMTHSSTGEEYLYCLMRLQHHDPAKMQYFDSLVNLMEEDENLRTEIQYRLTRIGRQPYNNAIGFAMNPQEQLLKNSWLYHIFGILPAAALVLSLAGLFPGILPALILLIVNFVIYYVKKGSVEQRITTIRYICSLITAADKMGDIKADDFGNYAADLKKYSAPVKKACRSAGAIMDRTSTLEVGVIVEYLRIALLSDFKHYNRLVASLCRHKEDFINIYEAVGRIDAAIATASWRRRLGRWCVPEYHFKQCVDMCDVCHPLLDNCEPNTVTIIRNTMITGSNASGKSTFLKAAAINAITGQTLATCAARAFAMPVCHVMSSMAVRDDVVAGESYFMAEIKSIGRIIRSTDRKIPILCIIDEILRGTNTIERIAAAASVLHYLSSENCICIAATHDAEICEILKDEYDNYHFSESVTAGGVTFDYKIYAGRAMTRNAIKLLEVMGYDQSIVIRAKELADRFEETGVW